MEKTCFVISPIGTDGTDKRKHADDVFDFVIKPAMEKCKIKAIRSDHMFKAGKISEQVYAQIAAADICVADLTDHNPNVFYELAFAQFWAKPVILLIEFGQNLPFDVKDFRTVDYELSIRSFTQKTYIDIIVNYVEEFESGGWKISSPFDYMPQKTYTTDGDFYIEPIAERRFAYEKAAEMINQAKEEVCDTTWGRDPKKTSHLEKVSRTKYRSALETALKRNVRYKDLFSFTADRKLEFKTTLDKYREQNYNYEAKCIRGMNDLPVIDVLINDNDEVLLSHVAFDAPKTLTVPTYLYIKSKTINKFFSGLFLECWNFAKDI